MRALFAQAYGSAPSIVARAPGRVEFIGNHTDYNGG
ncbi:MAG: galactokinase family protein, partial [Opitutae bacterium]|nr:galactokinase family protein [Opitutae bacterium]